MRHELPRLERLAGISPQYMSMLTASVNYLAHAPLLPAEERSKRLTSMTACASMWNRVRPLG